MTPPKAALICLAEKAGIRGTHLRLRLNPFESIRKRMSVVVKVDQRDEPIVYVKGAPSKHLNNAIES